MMSDPLVLLPTEIVLRILEFASVPSLASLTRTSRAWHDFIDNAHQDAIYSSSSKVERPPACRDFSFLQEHKSFAKSLDGTSNWKELCKRQTLLRKNWDKEHPTTWESVIQVGEDPVWRFKPDFKRRFIVSTSQAGGLNVTDMDTSRLLWQLSREEVRPYAHLEYQDGMAVWDRYGNAVEVWKADDSERGVFRQTAILQHDVETRGFQLSYDTLCVVSTEGLGFVYDMAQDPPQLRTEVKLEEGAIGHLDQNEEVVMYSLGSDGYHVHLKTTGELLGILQPRSCKAFYHIRHPERPSNMTLATGRHGASDTVFPPQNPQTDRFLSIKLEEGQHPERASSLSLEDDEWGAGMLSGSHMVGVSRGGRVYVCSDWRRALSSPKQADDTAFIVETEEDGGRFDFGGWLSIRNGRALFEVLDRIYIFPLKGEDSVPGNSPSQAPILATSSSSAPQLNTPVSFMGLYDDCLMSTYTVSIVIRPCALRV